MNVIAIIPARYASTRFPGKPLAMLKNKPIIQHVYEKAIESKLFNDVFVATDDQRIQNAVENFNGKVVMTSADHKSGTDRIAEACANMVVDIIINIQGDEPFISTKPLENLIKTFHNPETKISSLMHQIDHDIDNPNAVKVVTDKRNFALYFSRAKIPFDRDGNANVKYFKHIGVYAFRKKTLENFVKLPQGVLEKIENLEQLRLMENGIKIKMVETEYQGIGIDTPADLEKAEQLFDELY